MNRLAHQTASLFVLVSVMTSGAAIAQQAATRSRTASRPPRPARSLGNDIPLFNDDTAYRYAVAPHSRATRSSPTAR